MSEPIEPIEPIEDWESVFAALPPFSDAEMAQSISEMQRLAAEPVSQDRLRRDQERSESQR